MSRATRAAGRAPLRALARFELRRMLRSRATTAAAVAFVAVLALGHWIAHGSPASAGDDRLFGYAFLLGSMIGWRLGLSADRALGFQDYAVVNFLTPQRYLTGKLVAAAAWLAGFAAFACVAAIAVSAGDLRYAAWYAALFALVVWLFAPALVAAELLVETAVPAVLVALVFAVVAIAWTSYGGVEPLLRIMGVLAVERYRAGTLGPLVVRDVVIVPGALAAIVAIVAINTRRGRARSRVEP